MNNAIIGHARLHVEVQFHLIRVWAIAHLIILSFQLVRYPVLNQFLTEYVPFNEEIVVCFQRAQRLVQGRG